MNEGSEICKMSTYQHIDGEMIYTNPIILPPISLNYTARTSENTSNKSCRITEIQASTIEKAIRVQVCQDDVNENQRSVTQNGFILPTAITSHVKYRNEKPQLTTLTAEFTNWLCLVMNSKYELSKAAMAYKNLKRPKFNSSIKKLIPQMKLDESRLDLHEELKNIAQIRKLRLMSNRLAHLREK